ncbi:2-phosphosulfolactate phosphatase [Xenorhabdus stockiae]|uniref:2-phosphosulfolactate phosphatase n=1 Tax=Xenorhabdus stockiae TaxID=351614 RepID=UPI003CFA539C
MSWYCQSQFEVRLEWGLHAAENLAQYVDCVVIVDVMSFSTCVSIASDNNAYVYPYSWKDETAIQYARNLGALSASFNRKCADSQFSLSPASLQAIPEGTKLVLPSPNGSSISFKAKDYGVTVFSGCFRNITACARACEDFKRILVIPSGERWPDGSIRFSIEDYVAAGGIIASLGNRKLSPEAYAAVAVYKQQQQHGLSSLYNCSSALELKERGFEADVNLCLEIDVSVNANRLYDNFYMAV